MTDLKRIALLVVYTLMASSMAARGAAAQAAPAPVNEGGAAVFAAQKCSLCHALGGKGNPKGALDEVGAKLTADQIRQWILTPAEMAATAKAERKPAMKAFLNLPKEDLDALVAFLHSKKKK